MDNTRRFQKNHEEINAVFYRRGCEPTSRIASLIFQPEVRWPCSNQPNPIQVIQMLNYDFTIFEL